MTLDQLRALADEFFEWPEGSGRQTVTTFSALLFAKHVLEMQRKAHAAENSAGVNALRDAAQRQLDALAGYRREIGLLTGVPDEQPCDAEVAARAALEQEQAEPSSPKPQEATMSDPEALWLADALEGRWGPLLPILCAAACLRRQHAEIEALKAEIDENIGVINVWRRRTEQVEDERDALRADAERMEFLEQRAMSFDACANPDNYVDLHYDTDPPKYQYGRSLREAIDKATGETT